MNELARSLFEAHVAHELATQRKAAFDDRVTLLTQQVFEWLADVKLDDLLTREQVLAVIDRYVIQLRISGGITELAGQLSREVFSSEASAQTRVDQLLSDESFADYADKIESLQDAYREAVRLITETPTFRTLLTRGLTMVTVQLLFRSAGDDAAPAQGLLAGVRRVLGTELSQKLEQRLARYLGRNGERVVALSSQHLRDAISTDSLRTLADDLWDRIGPMRLSDLFAFLTVADVEDFWVISFETWLKFRKTPFFRATSTQVVDAIFQTYGGESVQSLLDEMGVQEAMVVHELRTLFGPVLAHATQTGLRELQVRQRLEAFYASDAVSTLLGRDEP
jgi:hypothetical protein